MSAGSLPGLGGKGHQSQDFELNITSIIDTFTVLITFMLASASFLSIGILDAGIAAGGEQATTTAPPSVNVEVAMNPDLSYTVKLSGKVTSSTPVPGMNGKYNLDGLGQALKDVKGRFGDVTAATLIADNKVEYTDIVRAMETTRKTLPYVLLGGF
jgi:biopolymer transport protein ExbD